MTPASTGPESAHAVEHVAHRRSERQRLRGRLHSKRHAHEQRIVEIAAQPCQRLAERRLGDVEHARGLGQAPLAKQHVKHLQVLQLELASITGRNGEHIHG
jgi:hypothetical protein